MRFWLPMICMLLGPLTTASATDAPEIEFTWQAPPSCPDQASARMRVERLLAHSSASDDDVRASARVERRGRRYWLVMHLLVQGRSARRELTADSCEALCDVAAWLLAVAVDPQTSERGADAAPQPGLPPMVASSTPLPLSENPAKRGQAGADGERAPRPTNVPAPSHVAPTFRVGVFTGVFAAGLAGPTGSLGIRTGIGFRHLVFDLFAAQHFERSKVIGGTGVSTRFATQELGLAGCAVWGGQLLHAGPCLALSGLRTLGQAFGVDQDQSATIWAIGTLSVTVDYRVFGPFQLRLDAGLFTSFTAGPRLEVDGTVIGEAAGRGGMIRFGVDASL